VSENQDDDKTQSYTSLTKDTIVGHYRIVEKIGAGGMGEVYLGEDTQLDRKVALKFLPHHLCQVKDCRARFKREALAAAKLSHPSIIHVYEVSEYNGRPFFVMEHVEGKSLRDYIAEKEFSIEQILELSIQICEGLYEAHQKGVTHRDIKPSNILIDSHGRAKIVDFGLASVAGTDQLTKTGSTLGTVGYMSPEQVQGKEIDHRTDLFSLGVVLYEIITKKNPFKRDTEAATLKAVIDDMPEPIARFKSGLPDGFQSIIDKALEKDSTTRYQHADGMLSDLTRISRNSSDSVKSYGSDAHKISGRPKWVVFVVSGLLLALFVYIAFPFFGVDTDKRLINQKQMTSLGNIILSDISPDGLFFAYVRNNEEGIGEIFVQDMLGSNPIRVFSDDVIYGIRWSPDSKDILISSKNDSTGGLSIISRLGGRYRKITRLRVVYNSMAWSPDGQKIACFNPTKLFMIVDKLTGEISQFTVNGPFEWTFNPQWSPDGKWIAFRTISSEERALWLLEIDSEQISKLSTGCDGSIFWSHADNSIYFLRAHQEKYKLMKGEIDLKNKRFKSEPTEIFAGINAAATISMTSDGTRLLYTHVLEWSNLWKLNLNNQSREGISETQQLTHGTSLILNSDISPNGKELAYSAVVAGERHIFKKRFDGSAPIQLTFSNSPNWSPAWSSSGDKLAFTCSDGQSFRIAVISSEGSNPRIYENSHVGSNKDLKQVRWGPSSFIQYIDMGNRNINLMNPISGIESQLISNNSDGYVLRTSGFSPLRDEMLVYRNWWFRTQNGEWVSKSGIWLLSRDDSSQTYLYPGFTFNLIGWSEDGLWVYAWQNETLLKVSIDHNRIIDTVGHLPLGEISEVAKGYSDSIFVFAKKEIYQDVWLVEGLTP